MAYRRQWRTSALLGTLALVIAACGGGGGESGGGQQGQGQAEGGAVVRHAASSAGEAYVGQYHAPEIFGDRFGISTENYLTEFDSHATSAQVLVSGGADVGSGGLTQLLQLIQEGQDFKAFCPVQYDSTEHLVGRTEAITSIDQITQPEIRVAVDSPGGLINFIMNLVFQERGLGITVDDLQNVTILEDGGLRLSALAAGDVDVGSVDLFEVADLRDQVGAENITVLSVTAEDVDFLANIYFAQSQWLEQNADLAGRYCATTLYANRVLASDLQQYEQVVDRFIEGGVEPEVTEGVWNFAREQEIWPYNDDQMTDPAAIEQVIQVSVDSGLLEESSRSMTYEDVVDPRPMEIAMELLGGRVEPADVMAGNPEP
jgi:ABC-type nitrate/sulfonate/bicarbonate transport system substrate-binding protein